MTQYISKSALIAEIDRQKIGYNVDGKHSAEYDIIRKIIDIIDALDVKEVDYGIEVHKYAQEHFNVYDDVNQTLQTKENKTLLGRKDFEDIAKYFFEFGLKAQKGE